MASSGLGAAGNGSGNAIDADARSRPACNPIPSGPKRSRSYSSATGGAADRTWHQAESAVSPSEAAGPGDGSGRPRSTTPNSIDAAHAAHAARKRRAGPVSRGVANLTPDQLARKRANDREAQRAIRERHRLRTEQYEQEIRELKSRQPYQELQAVLRQKEAVEAELAGVRRCMAAIMAMVQPILAKPAGAHAGDQSRPGPSPVQAHTPSQPRAAPLPSELTPTSVTSPVSIDNHGRWQGADSLSPVGPSASVDGQSQPSSEALLHQQRYGLTHGMDLGRDRLVLDFLVDPNQRVARIQGGIHGAQDSPQYTHARLKHDWTAATSPTAQPSTHRIPTIFPSTTFPAAPAPPTTDQPAPAPLPRNSAPTCPLDTLLLDFLAERRQRAAEGLSQTEILGPRYPSVSSLLNPAVSAYSHPLSRVFTDILARFPLISGLPERVAILYLMFVNMRWQVLPTRENHERLPPWFRPVPVQAEKAHAAWIDFVPFPQMRDRIVREFAPGALAFDDFFVPYTETICLNWPYDDAYVLLENPTTDEIMINPVFEAHLGMLRNWTLGDAFHRTFPGLLGTYNLKSQSS
ncbi:BZIP transcription factor [Trichocladium antarcticum]|uniref:BZIP transcription factor n=1 Tax=Trichocladium antarcticum TaxID=1450529 RepID=A0AAN6UMT6_9PEZI|nr:BZIP transcription factor [Trichocladium antarcticum]